MFDRSKTQLSLLNDSESEVSFDDRHVTLPQKLMDIPGIKGFEIVHQNIRCFTNTIDELRFVVSELKSVLQLLTLSETWTDNDNTDSELEIAGYQIFRRDRSKGVRGGFAVYGRNDVKVLRRYDLEIQRSKVFGLKFFRQNRTAFLLKHSTDRKPLRTTRLQTLCQYSITVFSVLLLRARK